MEVYGPEVVEKNPKQVMRKTLPALQSEVDPEFGTGV
jgi:hypothetical protein